MGRNWGWKGGRDRDWNNRDSHDRDSTDWHTGRWDAEEWLDRHQEKRGGPNDRDEGFEKGHCFHGHGEDNGKGHGGHDHWNNGQWRHACNNAPEIIAPTDPSILTGYGGVGTSPVQVVATDADPFDTLIYSIVPEDGGESADAELFLIDPNTGELMIAADLTPFGDENGDGAYEVTVEVTDGTSTTSIDLDIMFTFGG